MRESTVARNYAETLLTLAQRENATERYGALILGLADAIRTNVGLHRFLESPRVPAEQKSEIIGKALGPGSPRNFTRFLQSVIMHRRQMALPAISNEYADLLDQVEGRVHAQVTVARTTSDAERDAIAKQLSRALGKVVVPHLSVDPAILGGVVVKVGDTVMDGSVRRRLASLRNRLVGTR